MSKLAKIAYRNQCRDITMKTFKFLKNKYHRELLMDIGTYQHIPQYFFESELHQTDFYEIVFFSKGSGSLELDHHKIEITDNTIIFFSPFQKRRWFVAKESIKCHFLFFQNSFLSNFFSDQFFSYRMQFFYNKTRPLYIKASKELLLALTPIFKELLYEIKTLKSDSEHLIRSLLYFTLIKLNRVYAEKYLLSAETEINTIAYMFKALLIDNISKMRNIDFYAQKIGTSRVTLNKHVKIQFGITASEMVNEFIMSEIKSRLLHTNLSIKEISYALNFSEANHLTRFFKTNEACSPKHFRNAYQNGISVT